MTAKSRSQGEDLLLLAVAYIGLGSLGVSDTLLGIAWPSMRQTFGVPIDAMGILLIASTVGFFLSSFTIGQLLTRYGTGPVLIAGLLLRALGSFGYGLLPVWGTVIASGFVAGLGGGAIDVSLNNYVSTHYRASRLNWLHAAYGVGGTAAPLALTALLTSRIPWQISYIGTGLLIVGLILLVGLTLKRWQVHGIRADGSLRHGAPLAETLRLPVVWLSIVLFFFYTGVEATTGSWAFTLFTESRGADIATAGTWVSIYWACFTAGRVLIGFAADHVDPHLILRAGMGGAVVAGALIWWSPVNGIGYAGMALMGFSLAPLFAGMVVLTPERVGDRHATNAIGIQLGAAGLGVSGLAGLAGVLARAISLEVIGPVLVAGALVMTGLNETVSAHAARRTPRVISGPQREDADA
ncbi:MAG: MFS transporter [Anaerolineae bacterium]|nr:MFS transporter [Anaerolineae bacterium]